jgi:enhancing lycopene biosynthesis protein 2
MQLTIGSVRIDTNHESPIEYMCVETGVGSGSVWDERQLYASREEAEAVLPKMVADHEAGLIDRRAQDRKRKIVDGPGRMAAYYRAHIRDAEKTIADAKRGLEREAGKR